MTGRAGAVVAPGGKAAGLGGSTGAAGGSTPPGRRTAAGAEAATPTMRVFFRRWSFWLGAGVFVVIASLVLLLVRGVSGTEAGSDLSTTSAAPTGAKAIAEVLRQQGVTVSTADSLDGALRAVADIRGSGGAGSGGSSDPTVLIYDPSGYLPIDRRADLLALGNRIVLVQPDIFTLDALAPGVSVTGVVGASDVVEAGCGLAVAERAGTISTSGSGYRLDADGTDTDAGGGTGTGTGTECFPVGDGGFSLVQQNAGGSVVTVLGASGILTNEHALEAGNASLALGLLGSVDQLVWYLPSAADLTATGPPSLAALTPGWVTPLVVLLVAVFLAAALWRGRRLGPVVVENLPVIVRGSETVTGRARLYTRSNARSRALDALRIGTVTRLCGLLGLPRTAALPEIIAAVAASTASPPAELAEVLVNRLPRSDSELLALSHQLSVIERRVQVAVGRAPATPTPSSPSVRPTESRS
ncbi:hypothetical protein B7R54_03900 [Subtercola boreus]|uniref:DUF4350 domain-containing protein n=1 Tax=Subtercola boreus TaxID=120213 RepID=A0A3E0VEX3_9MICO|nr:DUF4350 domain-containing protein [Subtercola boreus]RFA08462.1 hypothetical protein B7R54_03900 [Subtercola boreus]TQL54620.1 uncharacterized protein DUF4350 [Subtercola boreus]